MAERFLPRYPVYVPSRGRWKRNQNLTAAMFTADGVPFSLVVEPQEADAYAEIWGIDRLIVLPFSDRGLFVTRNWIRDHAEAAGHRRHWQFDDNIREMMRYYRRRRVVCDAGIALRIAEDFTDQYLNIGVSGFNYVMFCGDGRNGVSAPYNVNCHVYSASLINHEMPARWRLLLNDDTDLCLQAIASGWNTVLISAFLANKEQTMTISGGNTDDLYKPEDGRLRMARMLERQWPKIVTTQRRFQRPQHVVHSEWKRFKTLLIRDPDAPPIPDYGLTLDVLRPPVHPRIQRIVDQASADGLIEDPST